METKNSSVGWNTSCIDTFIFLRGKRILSNKLVDFFAACQLLVGLQSEKHSENSATYPHAKIGSFHRPSGPG